MIAKTSTRCRALVLVGALLAISACSATQPVVAPSPPKQASPICGKVSAEVKGLLDAGEVSKSSGRSASATDLSADGCATAAGQPLQAKQCSPDEFPWARSDQTVAADLYARGASRITQATFTIAGKPVMKEVILTAAKDSDLNTVYRNHALECGAEAVATEGNTPVWVTGENISISFTDSAVIALISLNGQSVNGLMKAAVEASTW